MKGSFFQKTIAVLLILATIAQSLPYTLFSYDNNPIPTAFLEIDFDHESESENENEGKKELLEKKGKQYPFATEYIFAGAQHTSSLKGIMFLFKERYLDVSVPPPKYLG